ncbi:substrate-binding periplasmic protein [Pseudoduganella danionis]|jgi:polar amino acid transport system substrate-binding protein|uniref:substrate-binding periplasmic protein n=1 Tax=Pseudoduganella danionis TaxID=1890295 RepID=UPI0035AE04E3
MRLPILAAFCLVLFQLPAHAELVRACADQAEMPPFVYAERNDGRKSDHITGASVDLLRRIAERHGWQIEVQLLPWARCVAQVASQQIQIAVNISASDGVSNALQTSAPYYTLHNVYYTSRRARPAGIKLARLADLKNYHVCGMGGYRFEAYGISTSSVDRGTTIGYEQLINKLHLGRCDLFISNRETMAGQYLINPRLRGMLVDGTLVQQALPGVATQELYFGVAADSPQAASLLQKLNAGLERQEKNHTFETLLERYLQ